MQNLIKIDIWCDEKPYIYNDIEHFQRKGKHLKNLYELPTAIHIYVGECEYRITILRVHGKVIFDYR